MALFLVTAPAQEPLSLDEVKDHLRVDVADEDGLIASLLTAARQHVEAFTKRALVTQTWDLKLCGFTDPDYYQDGALWLPFPPVSSVTSISYVDTNGATQTWAAANYTTDLTTGPHARRARIALAYGISFPSVRAVLNNVTVRFVCGYGDPDAVPDGIRAAMKLLVGQWYAAREPSPVTVPTTVDALLWPFRAF